LSTTIASLIRKASFAPLWLLTALTAGAIAATPSRVELTGSPKIEGDQVTVRINVTDAANRPVEDLLDTDFKLLVDGEELNFDTRNWKRPEDATVPPSWVIVLLDMSGSMAEPDGRGTTKLEGALNAIALFKDTLAERVAGVPATSAPQLAIVPFGKPGPGCNGFPVTDNDLNKFFPADAYLLENHLNFLSGQVPCASTNLYEPIGQAIRLLGNEQDSRFYVSPESEEPTPRLSIILLSDGYHTEGKEAEDFEQLALLTRQNPDIIVHTLGYGLTPEELGKKYGLGKAATRADITSPNTMRAGKVPDTEFVDQARLAEIAQLTGGISEFSGDAAAVSEKLQVFLSALLGEYEINYRQPNAARGSSHTVQAFVEADGSGLLQSEPQTYTLRTFAYRSLPASTRAGLFAGTLAVAGVLGVGPFWIWANMLKKEDANQ